MPRWVSVSEAEKYNMIWLHSWHADFPFIVWHCFTPLNEEEIYKFHSNIKSPDVVSYACSNLCCSEPEE